MVLVSSCSCLCAIYWSQVVADEDVVGAAPTGAAPTTSEWSSILLPTKVSYIRCLTVHSLMSYVHWPMVIENTGWLIGWYDPKWFTRSRKIMRYFKSSKRSDASTRQWSAPGHYLNQYWLSVIWTLGTDFSKIWSKISKILLTKSIWTYRLLNGGYFCSASLC